VRSAKVRIDLKWQLSATRNIYLRFEACLESSTGRGLFVTISIGMFVTVFVISEVITAFAVFDPSI
jgi:hypothetical protein